MHQGRHTRLAACFVGMVAHSASSSWYAEYYLAAFQRIRVRGVKVFLRQRLERLRPFILTIVIRFCA